MPRSTRRVQQKAQPLRQGACLEVTRTIVRAVKKQQEPAQPGSLLLRLCLII